uniref:histidine--tRNA ligase n=1 Tax=Quercus lobata TaxID=97700 RepID=A0A7N2M6P8_QUELO
MAVVEVSWLFGFEEVDFPALYIRKAGKEIRDQLYCFEDRGNRRVALRPELTPSLARLEIQKYCIIVMKREKGFEYWCPYEDEEAIPQNL